MRSGARRITRWLATSLILIFAFVGFLYLTRGTAVRHVRGVGAEAAPVAVGELQFPLGVALLTGAALTPGHRVEVALDGDGTFERLWADLRSARQSITIQVYYGKAGRMASTLGEILVERAAAGVSVFVLYDAFGFDRIRPDDIAGLRAAGVQVVAYRPLRLSTLHLAQNRSHVRGVVVDGRVGWTGGFGIDDQWWGDGRTGGSWRETNVRFEGPAVLQLQAAFAAAWVEATGVMFSGRATLESPEGAGVLAGLLATSPTMGTTATERFFALSIAGAQRTLYITNSYFAPDHNFVGLIAAAARRGVDVRVLTAGPRTDVQTVRLAGRARYDALLSAGVRVYEWQPTTLHAKTFVADGVWSTIGSMNLDNRSLALNDEATLMVLDRELGRELETIFFEDLRHAEEITLEDFRRRPWLERFAEQSAKLFTRLL